LKILRRLARSGGAGLLTSIMACSKSASSADALNVWQKASAFTHLRNRLNTEVTARAVETLAPCTMQAVKAPGNGRGNLLDRPYRPNPVYAVPHSIFLCAGTNGKLRRFPRIGRQGVPPCVPVG